MRQKVMVPIGFSVRQLNNGRWYVVRHGRNTQAPLRCENGGYRTSNAAALALKRELRQREKEKGNG